MTLRSLPLAGLQIGILQARHGEEIVTLLEREGAMCVHAPCLRERRSDHDEELRRRLARLTEAPADLYVFQTGVGTRALFALAAEDGLAEALTAAVRAGEVAARGPKPLRALLDLGFTVDRRTREPHTSAQMIEALADVELRGRRVALQHYGSANVGLVEHLRSRGAEVVELFSYRWALPEDLEPITRLLGDLAAGRLAVVAFTSAAQVENLFTVAAEQGTAADLPRWLNEQTTTAAVGPACAGALEERGVRVAIQPERPKMVPFVRAIAAGLGG
jgi:uroporphyrinogen-III synthase